MAEEATEDPKSSTGLVKVLVVSLIVSLFTSGGVGAGVYFLLQSQSTAAGEGEAEEAAEEEPKGPPLYYELEEPFVVNLAQQPARFLQVSVQLMTRDEKVVEAVERHVPVIRNNLLILFSSQQLEAISTREGKEALRQAALKEVRSVLESQGEPVEVEDIYFTSLVVQ